MPGVKREDLVPADDPGEGLRIAQEAAGQQRPYAASACAALIQAFLVTEADAISGEQQFVTAALRNGTQLLDGQS